MVNFSNAWPNYYVGYLWLIVFMMFVAAKYPHHDRGDKK
ncbi:hypothetical protein MM817_02982 [Acidibacillus sp. S0AB]|uniref:Uncharacterized protein n=1 Tax=Sulfoacidibacillus ferrooxidans TaxID=2005001 RepID=A0A9X1VBM9_9BACL|nr:hypothetical protein [Sulfoacidibacillus ferrooxidans]MCI0184504.1 hypothetical protein [Sulfoacidibacillus ferrooxidans]MCI0184685.1 hypothetical protein [Sulfoacidibacillus ferrooxidans]